MGRYLLFASFVVFSTGILAKDDPAEVLKQAYENSFKSPSQLKSKSDFSGWMSAVLNMKSFVNAQKDKTLSSQFDILEGINKRFINATTIWVNERKDLGKFTTFGEEAAAVVKTLQKQNYILPGKRKSREAMNGLAEAITKASTMQDLMVNVSKLATLRELNRLSKQFEGQLRIEKAEAQEDFSKLKSEWIEKRRATIEDIKKRQALKAEEITKLSDEMLRMQESLEQLNGFLETIPAEMALTLHLALLVSGDPLNQSPKEISRLDKQIERSRKDVLNMQEAMARVDELIAGSVQDPNFDKGSNEAKAKVAAATKNLEDVNQLLSFNANTKSLSESASSLSKSFQEKSRQLNCPSLQGKMTDAKRSLDNCRNSVIGSVAKIGNIIGFKQCLITLDSDDPTIESCAKALGLSYLNLPTN